MAISYIGAGSKVEGDSLSTVNVPYPATVAAGDLLIVQVAHKDTTYLTAPDSSWTLIRQGGGTTQAYNLFYKIATGSETGSAAFTGSDIDACVGHMLRFTGVDSVTPIGAYGTANTGTDATCEANTITTTKNNSVVCQFVFIADDDGDTLTKASWSALQYNETIQGTDSAVGGFYLAYATSGTSTGTQTITQTLSNAWTSFMVELIPWQGPAATLSKTLDAVTISATGTLGIVGTLSKTLDNVTLSGTSTLDIQGTFSKTLDSVTLSSAGTVEISGTLTKTLDNVSLSSTVAVEIQGVLTQTLDAIGISAASTVDIAATLAKTLEDVVLASTFTVTSAAGGDLDLNITLDDVSISAYGTLDIQATATVTLDSVQIVSTIFKWHYIDPDSDDVWTLAVDTGDVWSDQVDTGDVWTDKADTNDTWTNTSSEATTWH